MHTADVFLLQRDQAALVVIDVQDRLLPAIAEGEGVVRNIVKLLRFARIIGLPVLLSEQQKLGPTVSEIRAELPEHEPITKLEFGCFGCEAFTAAVERLGRSALIMAGIEAHICVAQTALQAVSRYRVHVVADAVSSRSLHDRDMALWRLRQCGVTVTTTEMLIYELLGRAGTDEFRAVLQLVKGS